MRAYSDSTTELRGHNEELRTGIFSRTYGLQGIVVEIEEKNSLKKRLDEMEKLLKAHGIVVHVLCFSFLLCTHSFKHIELDKCLCT